jgi:hypothetical protein
LDEDEAGLDRDEPLLIVEISDVLLAYVAVTDRVPAHLSDKEKESRQRALALDLLDWATIESDRGRMLTEMKAQLARKYRGDDGTLRIGKP